MFNVIAGFHPITGERVNMWYTSETGDRYRCVSVNGGWMVCNESKGSRWITKEVYATFQDAMRENP